MDDVRAVLDAVECEQAARLRVLRGRTDERAVRGDLSRAERRRSSFMASSRSGSGAPTTRGRPSPTIARVRSRSSSATGPSGWTSTSSRRPRTTRSRIVWPRTSVAVRAQALAAALMRMNTQIDVRDVLPTIQAPTLVLHRTGRPRRERRGGPLDRGPDPRSEVRRAPRRCAHALGRRHGRASSTRSRSS